MTIRHRPRPPPGSGKCSASVIRLTQNERTAPMPLTMYQASVPVFDRMLSNLTPILEKAQSYAGEKRVDISVLLSARLYPDMLPLMRQIQIATDHAKGATARLSGGEPPKFSDEEQTIEDIKGRIARTVEYIRSVPAAKFDGSETRSIVLNLGANRTELDGQTYLFNFALPNFFFHVTTAYGILRHNGVTLG